MKFQSALIAAFALCLTTAVAAPPPTPYPGTPSGLVPLKHPPYTSTCLTGFTANPATFDVSDLNANYQCGDNFGSSGGCDQQNGFGVDWNAPHGFLAEGKLYFACRKYQGSNRIPASLSCGNQTAFSAGPYDPKWNLYTCTSAPLACSGGLVLDQGSDVTGFVGGVWKYKCKRAG